MWHHQDWCRRGPKELTGIMDLTPGQDHPTAHLLDLVPGRSSLSFFLCMRVRGRGVRSG